MPILETPLNVADRGFFQVTFYIAVRKANTTATVTITYVVGCMLWYITNPKSRVFVHSSLLRNSLALEQ